MIGASVSNTQCSTIREKKKKKKKYAIFFEEELSEYNTVDS